MQLKRVLFTLIFLEGFSVMVAELVAGMLVAPFFGTSLSSWALVLSITLAGLATGYYWGGWLSKKAKAKKYFVYCLALAGALLAAMPLLAAWLMPMLVSWPLLAGLATALLLTLFLPLVGFGCAGPLAVGLLNTQNNSAGSGTGKVYALSTIGGIVGTLLFGLYIIPSFGLKLPTLVCGLGLFLLVWLLIGLSSTRQNIVAGLTVALLVLFGLKKEPLNLPGPFKQLHASEGLLGQLRVVDMPWRVSHTQEVFTARAITVNNTWQTAVNINNGVSILNYVYFLMPIISSYNPKDKMLVIGLGGGGLVTEMQRKGYYPTVVELDQRLPALAHQYFGMQQPSKVVVKDGRHFLNTNKKAFDLIVLDVFQGEVAPWQLFTLESFKKLKASLSLNGCLAIEFFGGVDSQNLALPAVVKTLQQAGLQTQIIKVGESENLIVASRNWVNLNDLGYHGKNYVPKDLGSLGPYVYNLDKTLLARAPLLEDDWPILEKLSSKASFEWRKYQNSMFRDNFVRQALPLFY